MPKSRLRKGHKSKAASFKKRVEDRKKSFEKQMRTLYEQQQQEALAKQINDGSVDPEQIDGGLNVNDFKLETEPEIIPTIPGIVEGITQPEL